MATLYLETLTGLFDKVEAFRQEKASAGTMYRLMALCLDINEVTVFFQKQVLSKVCCEVLLNVDIDINYAKTAQQVLQMKLIGNDVQVVEMMQQIEQVNEALEKLSKVLFEIAGQLLRSHQDKEFVRLYERELQAYKESNMYSEAQTTYLEWMDNNCSGQPSQEDMHDYLMGKLIKIFEQGVFNDVVGYMQRPQHFDGEVDLEHLDDNPNIIKTAKNGRYPPTQNGDIRSLF